MIVLICTHLPTAPATINRQNYSIVLWPSKGANWSCRSRIATCYAPSVCRIAEDMEYSRKAIDVTLQVRQIPAHNHDVAPRARNGGEDEINPGGGFMASASADLYADPSNTTMGITQSANTGV